MLHIREVTVLTVNICSSNPESFKNIMMGSKPLGHHGADT